MFIQKGQATKRGRVHHCRKCGAIWKSTGRHKPKGCPVCEGWGVCDKKFKVKK